jgi:calnexin
MFGPDKCGHNNKVHFIVNHKNPKTGEYEEKHLKTPPQVRITKTTELYTLIVHPNNTYVIKQNNEQVRTGSLLEDFDPAFNPPKEIEDPDDVKPKDWVDQIKIADPEAVKPEDWDEDAPYEIVDEDAVKPEDWLEDEPLTIPDPEAEKPEDWDDEEDGDWMPPTVPNSKCDEASGCGPWTKPMKPNPEYKGKWVAPLIDNPDYKGPWAPRKIPNPAYFEEKHPANLEPMGAIGFEIWTMQNDIMFDNIYIGHSVEDADKFAQETFAKKHAAEKLVELAEKPATPEPPKPPGQVTFTENPVAYLKEKVELFVLIAKQDPIQAIKFVPEIAIGLAVAAFALLGALIALLGSAAPAPAKVKKAAADAKDKAVEVKDKAAAAAASGVDSAKAEVSKRQTRSQTQEL